MGCHITNGYANTHPNVGPRSKGAGLYVLCPSAAHVPARVTAFRDCVAAAFVAFSVTAIRPAALRVVDVTSL
jgi:hypothetical protein